MAEQSQSVDGRSWSRIVASDRAQTHNDHNIVNRKFPYAYCMQPGVANHLLSYQIITTAQIAYQASKPWLNDIRTRITTSKIHPLSVGVDLLADLGDLRTLLAAFESYCRHGSEIAPERASLAHFDQLVSVSTALRDSSAISNRNRICCNGRRGDVEVYGVSSPLKSKPAKYRPSTQTSNKKNVDQIKEFSRRVDEITAPAKAFAGS